MSSIIDFFSIGENVTSFFLADYQITDVYLPFDNFQVLSDIGSGKSNTKPTFKVNTILEEEKVHNFIF